ncbi:AAA family ATPase [Solirubrobacter sp. CPCC 204708]|uniref:AAA family ATPase n=1 Tax=Solirubrobacter deserti TaxID=2282478 RepID=A0ABT4RG65_9ACTN|nr:AAA family ATPase [Solirubrobacter deserti]MBE2319725.1 AAA family ATPase [Solirubrobacter deserti]MDA0137535.1 AAA family ATPase [Solirubrobacter deserti]
MEELEEEQEHLDQTCAAFDAAFAALTGRGEYRGDDEYANEALEAMRRERIRVYTEASGPLYFGRIDRAEGGTLYVGRHAIWSAENDLLAVNWRAPAAEPFYTATERDPHGVRRRRRLEIEDRTVLGFVDEPLDSDFEDHLTEAIVEDITRQRVGEMRQIISTITPDQYELIARDVDGALVIQGGPGTGKTAVGLHRAAWLLYANPQLGREGVLVVGPNETFIRYVEQVLPALGESAVEQRAIGSLVTEPHGETDEARELATLKGSARIAVVLHRLLWDRLHFEDIEIPVSRRVTATVTADEQRELVAAVRERTFSYEAGRERFRERLAGTLASRILTRDSLAGSEEAVRTIRKAKEYSRAVTKAWPKETPEGLVKKLFTNRARLERVAGDLLEPEEIALLLKASAATSKHDMTPTDVALLDEAHWLIDPGFRRFGHVVVDEAQNLTPMELRMTVRRARGQSLTILGDLAQRTADAGVSSWERVLREAGVDSFDVSELEVSYRVPNEFLRIAGTLLPPGAPAPRGVRDAPFPPRAVHTDTLGAAAADEARRLVEAVNGSVGVVAPLAHMDEVRAALGEFADATHAALGAGINLLDLHVAKGLEFDAIVVVEPAAILRERPDGGVGGLYTALTRATRALSVIHAEPLPEPMRDAFPT